MARARQGKLPSKFRSLLEINVHFNHIFIFNIFSFTFEKTRVRWRARAHPPPALWVSHTIFLTIKKHHNHHHTTMQRQKRPWPINTGRIPREHTLASPLIPNEFNTVNFKKKQLKKIQLAKTPTTLSFSRPYSDSLVERKSVNVAGMLTHFKNIIMLATAPAGDGGESKEIAAAHALQMEVETNALVLDLAGL